MNECMVVYRSVCRIASDNELCMRQKLSFGGGGGVSFTGGVVLRCGWGV